MLVSLSCKGVCAVLCVCVWELGALCVCCGMRVMGVFGVMRFLDSLFMFSNLVQL